MVKFIYAWLPVVFFHAHVARSDMERFLGDAWAAFQKGESARQFGSAWK
jgi:hypothetical protein